MDATTAASNLSVPGAGTQHVPNESILQVAEREPVPHDVHIPRAVRRRRGASADYPRKADSTQMNESFLLSCALNAGVK